MTIFIVALIFIIGSIVIFLPFLGVVFTATSLQVVDILPEIPIFSSIIPLIGVFTLAGFLISLKKNNKTIHKFTALHYFGIFFVLWLFISNPEAAWYGRDRNWIFTYFQLLVLAFLTGELLNTPHKHRIFFWIFSSASAISAIIAFQQGYIGDSISDSIRSSGLAEGANDAARYFVIALIFFSYLRSNEKKQFPRILATIGILITFFGVFFTLSRTGILALFFAIGLLIILNRQKKQKNFLILIFLVSIVSLFIFSDNIANIIASIIPTITSGTDTIGVRYKLWAIGIEMWLDNPIQGVGIGMYQYRMAYYADNLPSLYRGAVTHNTYIQILSEAGIIGLLLFVGMITQTIRNFLNSRQFLNVQHKNLQNVWLIVFIVILFSGLTKNQSADKLVWLVMGVSIYFEHLKLRLEKERSSKKNVPIPIVNQPNVKVLN